MEQEFYRGLAQWVRVLGCPQLGLTPPIVVPPSRVSEPPRNPCVQGSMPSQARRHCRRGCCRRDRGRDSIAFDEAANLHSTLHDFVVPQACGSAEADR